MQQPLPPSLATPPKKSRPVWQWIVGGVVALFVCAGIAGSMGGNKPATSNQVALPAATGTSTQPTRMPEPTQAVVAPAEPTATVAAAIPLILEDYTASVSPGKKATVRIKTLPGTRCAIFVGTQEGESTAKGLDPADADPNGIVTWTWIIGTKTASGSVPVRVTCGNASVSTEITVP